MAERVVRFGVIGGGLMGRELASAAARWIHLADLGVRPELVVVCDTNPDALAWFERLSPRPRLVSEYRELLADDEVEAVFAAVPHSLHEEVFVACPEAGKHLLGEKPFGIDLAANDAISAAEAVCAARAGQGRLVDRRAPSRAASRHRAACEGRSVVDGGPLVRLLAVRCPERKERTPMSSKSKRQQTMAKRTREQTVKERRALKQEKKAAAAAARLAAANGTAPVDADGDRDRSADDELAAPETTELPTVGLAQAMAVAAGHTERLLIGGEWVEATGGGRFDVTNPANGEVVGSTPDATADDVRAAINAAADALEGWRNTTALVRARMLRKSAEVMRERADEIGRLMTARAGQAAGRGARRGRVRRELHRVVRGRGRAHLRRGRAAAEREQPRARAAPGRRRRSRRSRRGTSRPR